MKSLIILSLFGLFLFSCSKPVKLNLEEPPRIVIRSLLSPGNTIEVNVSRSFSPLINNQELYIPDPNCQGCYLGIDTQKIIIKGAKVEMFEDGTLLEQLSYTNAGNYRSQYVANANHDYELKVSAEDYMPIHAETTVPRTVEMDTILFSLLSQVDQKRTYKATITYEGEEGFNRYMFSAYSVYYEPGYQDGSYYSLYIGDRLEAGDIGSSSNIRNVIYWEETNDGQMKEKDLYFSYYDYDESINDTLSSGNDTLVFIGVFQNVNKSYYLTRKTITKYEESDYDFGSFFTEPVQLYNNIEGGLGSFSAYSSDTLRIDILL
jgi:hypothetical protein